MTDEENEMVDAFPESMDGVTDWVSRPDFDPGNIVVTREGLKMLLNLVGDMWPVVAGSLISKVRPHINEVYEESFDEKNLADLANRVSAVWCQGELIVSGLFTTADGSPVVNDVA